jgi:hypothetical protein
MRGSGALVRLYIAIGSGGGGPTGVDRAFRQVLGMTLAQFTQDWRTYVRQELA